VIETFHHQVNLQQQTLRVDIAKNLPPLVSDSFMLNRILVELLNNACKYTPAGEQILVAIAAQPNGIQLLVSNSGVEIPSTELPHIFDPFYRIPNDDPWKRGGTGLGLSLTKKLVEYLGGTIRAESRSRNVRFIVDLPFRDLVKD
jgi:signal transduction histidine kinase